MHYIIHWQNEPLLLILFLNISRFQLQGMLPPLLRDHWHINKPWTPLFSSSSSSLRADQRVLIILSVSKQTFQITAPHRWCHQLLWIPAWCDHLIDQYNKKFSVFPVTHLLSTFRQWRNTVEPTIKRHQADSFSQHRCVFKLLFGWPMLAIVVAEG